MPVASDCAIWDKWNIINITCMYTFVLYISCTLSIFFQNKCPYAIVDFVRFHLSRCFNNWNKKLPSSICPWDDRYIIFLNIKKMNFVYTHLIKLIVQLNQLYRELCRFFNLLVKNVYTSFFSNFFFYLFLHQLWWIYAKIHIAREYTLTCMLKHFWK